MARSPALQLPAPGDLVAIGYEGDTFDARIVLIDRGRDLVVFRALGELADDLTPTWVGDLEVGRLSELTVTVY